MFTCLFVFWMKVINKLFLQLNIDSQQVLAEDNLFLDMADKALMNREYKDFNDG